MSRTIPNPVILGKLENILNIRLRGKNSEYSNRHK
jgi:hypothetical protein